MKGDLKYIIILVGAVLVFVLIKFMVKDPIDWRITYSHQDKNPFGSYLINERLPDIFPNSDVEVVNQTIYELKDNDLDNVLIIAERLSMAKEDTDALLNMVNDGANFFLASRYFFGHLADTLGIDAEDYFFNDNILKNVNQSDTAQLSFVNENIGIEGFTFSRKNTPNYFEDFDSLEVNVIAINDLEKPIMVKISHGKGNIFLCSTPIAFTNNYLLFEENNKFVSRALSYLPNENVLWTEYYQLGRIEPRTPIRFLLSTSSLSWALGIAVFSLLFFILFESKRRQRIIPIITPLRNSTLEFIGTISTLYFQKKDHKSIAEKRINFFLDKVRTHYFIGAQTGDRDFIEKLIHKSGNDEDLVKQLFAQIHRIRTEATISEKELMALSKRIDDFKII